MQTNVTSIRTVKSKGNYLNTQDVANLLGRNWQAINKMRSAGNFIPPAARLGNAFLYSRSAVGRWAKKQGYTVDAASFAA